MIINVGEGENDIQKCERKVNRHDIAIIRVLL